MEFETEVWEIKKIIDLYHSNKLDLSPPYQRNEIWGTKTKKLLIDSIKRNFPLPNFFIYERRNDKFEMVDGQQRTRTIIGYYNKLFTDFDNNYYSTDLFESFLSYEITVIKITSVNDNEAIEEFYARVNSTGLKLNRPELKKAEYYNTRFLALLQELASYNKFENLEIFTESSLNRMNDVDFVSELIAQLKFGNTEKKHSVDRIFETDISHEEAITFKNIFYRIIEIFERFNLIYPLKKTRYKQRNDFYTLFGFIKNNLELNTNSLSYFYKILVLIGEDITPSNEKCEPLREYARNCISQSNSKKARDERIEFFNDLFLNESSTPNEVQNGIMAFYTISDGILIQVERYHTLDAKKIQEIVEEPILDFN